MTNMDRRRSIIPGFDRILHGGDYNPDQWLRYPEVIDEDFRLMPLAGCNTFAVGIFAWTSYEREEGRFDFGWLDGLMDRMARAGNKVILATPSGAKPAWLSVEYPEIRRVNREGRREPHEARHNHCWSSPVYRDRVRIINSKLAERYKGHPALGMWHISNEYSGACYCELCISAWHGWLERKYGSLDALNDAWWAAFWSHTFSDFSQIDPRDWSIDGMQIDFRRFNTWQVCDFYDWEVAPLKQQTPQVPCTTNFMGTFSGIDYSELAKHVDVVADDQYPAYYLVRNHLARAAVSVSFKDELYRCMKPDRPWMLMESCPDAVQWRHPMRLKRPGMHDAEMLQALGHGAEGTCYFQWRKGRGGSEKLHGAVVDHEGSERTRVFGAVAELGAKYEKLGEILGSLVEADVAIIYDWEARWGFEHSGGAPAQDGAYERVCHDHYQPFWERGISVDVISSTADFSRYRLLIAPQLWMLKPGTSGRLRVFVENGGTLVATVNTGICDEHNRCFTGGWPGDGLGSLFGIWHEETDCVWQDSHCRVDVIDEDLGLEKTYRTRDVRGLVHLRGARKLATYGEEFYAGMAALTAQRTGKGEAFFQAAVMELDFVRDFYGAVVRKLGIASPLSKPLPQGVTLQRRIKPGVEYLFLQNFSEAEQTLDVSGEALVDLLGNASVEALRLAPFGTAILRRSISK